MAELVFSHDTALAFWSHPTASGKAQPLDAANEKRVFGSEYNGAQKDGIESFLIACRMLV